MNIDGILTAASIPLFIHACLIFFQSVKVGPSQYDSLLSININGLSESLNVNEVFNHRINKEYCCQEIFSSILIWAGRLRILGFIPLILYTFCLFIFLSEFVLKDQINTNFITNSLYGSAIAVQFIYVYSKIKSNIPSILLDLLKEEYQKSNFIYIVLDISPILK